MAKVSLEKDRIKILLLEGLHPSSVEVLQAAGTAISNTIKARWKKLS